MKNTYTAQDLFGTIEMLRGCNCLPRWSRYVQRGYNEVAKQALNSQIAAILFELVAHEGTPINFSLLPVIAIKRGFEKLEKCDILEETYEQLFYNDELKNRFDQYLREQVEKATSKDFTDSIWDYEGTAEYHIYKAATALATYIELQELRGFISEYDYEQGLNIQMGRLMKYKDMPIIREIVGEGTGDGAFLMSLFKEMSSLRNRVRWVKHICLKEYSVLGHSYDVAVLNYVTTLMREPGNVAKAERGFYIGLYHDLAEIWTGDMPSPIKDAIPGLRAATESYERLMLEHHVFPYIPTWLLDKFKGVMLELVSEEEKAYYKEGDNLAAVIEAATQVKGGSKDKYFSDVVLDAAAKNGWSDAARHAIGYLLKEIS